MNRSADSRSSLPRSPAPLMREVIGRLLRVRRVARGLTLADVADRAGISTQYLSEVERGLKDASSEMIAAIAGALGMQLHDVLVLSSHFVAPVAPGAASALASFAPAAPLTADSAGPRVSPVWANAPVSTGSPGCTRGEIMLAA